MVADGLLTHRMMIDNELKEKIKIFMNAQEFLCDKYVPTDKEWEKYFIDNYTDECAIEVIDESFITYGVFDDHIFIKDMVCFGKGWTLLNRILKKASDKELSVRAMVHFSNEQIVDILQERFGFEIISELGSQYLLEKES